MGEVWTRALAEPKVGLEPLYDIRVENIDGAFGSITAIRQLFVGSEQCSRICTNFLRKSRINRLGNYSVPH